MILTAIVNSRLVPFIISIALAIVISDMRKDGTISKDEDSLLFSNLVSIGSIFLAVLLFVFTLYATKGATSVCSPLHNTLNQTKYQNCINLVDNDLNALGGLEVLIIGAFFFLAVLFRARIYSHYDNSGSLGKRIRGFFVWIFLLLPIMFGLFTVLSLSLVIVSISPSSNATNVTTSSTAANTVDNYTNAVGIVSTGFCSQENAIHTGFNTTEVEGIANISELEVNTSSVSGSYNHSGSLQLNTILTVKTLNGNYSYWIQNVAQFMTNTSTLDFIANIWNFTANSSGISNSTFIGELGKGNASDGKNYAFSTNVIPYNTITPSGSRSLLKLFLVINVITNSSQPSIQFEYYNFSDNKLYSYDNVSIKINSNSISLIAAPTKTGSGKPEDLELVFGGVGNDKVAFFDRINSNTMLLYYNNNSKTFSQINCFGIIGDDTGEKAQNITVSCNDGSILIHQGLPEWSTLYNGLSCN